MSQEITVVVIGIQHMQGTSDKGKGSAYDFANITYLKNANPQFKNSYMERKECGFDTETIGFFPADFMEFSKMQFGQKVTLILEPDPQDIKKSIVVGFKRPEQKAA